MTDTKTLLASHNRYIIMTTLFIVLTSLITKYPNFRYFHINSGDKNKSYLK